MRDSVGRHQEVAGIVKDGFAIIYLDSTEWSVASLRDDNVTPRINRLPREFGHEIRRHPQLTGNRVPFMVMNMHDNNIRTRLGITD